jgi:hypothetical protein
MTAIGGFAGTASSYRRVMIPLSVRICCCGVAIDLVRTLPIMSLSGAILHIRSREICRVLITVDTLSRGRVATFSRSRLLVPGEPNGLGGDKR